MDELTPLDKIKQNLKKSLQDDELVGRKKVVLVSTGSFCPIHVAHVEMFHIAKRHLESQLQMDVVGGFISPSHDIYVKGKLGKEFIPSKHRVAMCEKAIEDSDWISVDQWESSLTYFASFVSVVEHVDELIRKNIRGWNVQVMYLLGADLLLRAPGCVLRLKKHGVVCVGRPTYTDSVKSLCDKRGPSYSSSVIFAVGDESDVSSTKIRNNLFQGKDIDSLTFPGVVAYLEEHGLYHHLIPGKKGHQKTNNNNTDEDEDEDW